MDSDEFAKAVRKIPPPLSAFANGAGCPWCGAIHRTITFGENLCDNCQRGFLFGYPDWHSGDDPISWVNFPFREFDAIGGRADLLEDWEPNEQLKHHYFQKSEETLGKHADKRKPQ